MAHHEKGFKELGGGGSCCVVGVADDVDADDDADEVGDVVAVEVSESGV